MREFQIIMNKSFLKIENDKVGIFIILITIILIENIHPF